MKKFRGGSPPWPWSMPLWDNVRANHERQSHGRDSGKARVCSDQGQGPGQGGRRGEGRRGGPASVHHRLPQSDYAFLRTGGSQRPTPSQGKQPRCGILWCAMLVGLGNESHVAGACPCCVVGWEGGGGGWRARPVTAGRRCTTHLM